MISRWDWTADGIVFKQGLAPVTLDMPSVILIPIVCLFTGATMADWGPAY